MARSLEPSRSRRSSPRSREETRNGTDEDLQELQLEEMAPLLAEKFAMAARPDQPRSLEDRLLAMTSMLWEPLIDEEEEPESLLTADILETGKNASADITRKTRKRRRSNKMTMAEALGILPQDELQAESADIEESKAQTKETEEALAPETKPKRRRKSRSKSKPSEEASEADEQAIPETASDAVSETVESADDLLEEPAKKNKRRRRRKKKTAVEPEAAEDVLPVSEEIMLPEEAAELPDEALAEKKKSKRRRRKKKKGVQPAGGDSEAETLPEPTLAEAQEPIDGTETEPISEEGEQGPKKSKRRRRKKKTKTASPEPEIEQPQEPVPEPIESELDGGETVIKKRRRRRSPRKKTAVELDQQAEPSN